MNFLPESRNFEYANCTLQQFMDTISQGGKEYFRALSSDERDVPANFHKDFSAVACDFVLPSELKFVDDNLHSSVLRISGPVTMWLHYDVGTLNPQITDVRAS